jgi:hypothetical protein
MLLKKKINMKILERINSYIKVADFLEEKDAKALLYAFEEQIQKKEFLLPFIGQFSAGKSKLLNRLLGSDILPTKSSETTPFLTYIRYGLERKSYFIMADGSIQDVDLDKIIEYDQKFVEECNLHIDSLQIEVPVDCLKSGLVFVDTPGLNTLNENHVNMTSQLLSKSQFVVYLMAGSPSAVDIEIVKQFESLAINAVFVRTHIDLLKSNEENSETSILETKDLLTSLLKHDVSFFPIANADSSTPRFDSYFSNFSSFLEKNIISQYDVFYVNAINERLDKIHDDFLTVLQNKKNIVASQSVKTLEELEEQRSKINNSIRNVQNELSINEKKLKNEGLDVLSNIKMELKERKQNLSDGYNKQIEGVTSDISSEELRSNLIKRLSNDYNVLSQIPTSILNKWVSNSADDINVLLNKEKENALSSIQVGSDFSSSVVSEYAEKEAQLQHEAEGKMNQLAELSKMNEAELNAIGVKKENLNKAIVEFGQIITQKQNGLNDFVSSYTPRHIVKESKAGRVLGKVGAAIDIAMLLIPATGWEKAGTKLLGKAGKLAGKTAELSKLKKAEIYLLETAGKTAHKLGETDNIKDMTEVVSKGGSILSGNEKKENIFSYLQVEHWLRTLGEAISPTTKELDTNYENQYLNEKSNLEEELNNLRNEYHFTTNQMQNLGTSSQRLTQKERSYDRQKKDLQETFDYNMNKLKSEAKEKKNKVYQKFLMDSYDKSMDGYVASLCSDLSDLVDKLSSDLIKSANDFYEKQLTSTQEQLQKLIEQKKCASGEDQMVLIDEQLQNLG